MRFVQFLFFRHALEENLILVETIPIKEYTYNRFVVSFGGKLWII